MTQVFNELKNKYSLSFFAKRPIFILPIIYTIFLILFLLFRPSGDQERIWIYWLGEKILKDGIPHSVDLGFWGTTSITAKEWLFSVILAFFVDHHIGIIFLFILGLCTATPLWFSAFYLEKRQPFFLSSALISLSFFYLCYKLGYRAESFSFLFICLEIYLLCGSNRWLLFLPLLLCLWSNIHGSFLLGLLIFLPFFFYKKSQNVYFILIFVASCFSTLINPYGIEPWKHALEMSLDPFYKNWIIEWYSLIKYNALCFVLLLFPVLFGFIFGWKSRFSFIFTIFSLFIGALNIRLYVIFVSIFNSFVFSQINPITFFNQFKKYTVTSVIVLILMTIINIFYTFTISATSKDFHIDKFGVFSYESIFSSINMEKQRVFCDNWASCNIFIGSSTNAFIDGRLDYFPQKMRSESIKYFKLENPEQVDRFLREYNIKFFEVSAGEIPYKVSKSWKLVRYFANEYLYELPPLRASAL